MAYRGKIIHRAPLVAESRRGGDRWRPRGRNHGAMRRDQAGPVGLSRPRTKGAALRVRSSADDHLPAVCSRAAIRIRPTRRGLDDLRSDPRDSDPRPPARCPQLRLVLWRLSRHFGRRSAPCLLGARRRRDLRRDGTARASHQAPRACRLMSCDLSPVFTSPLSYLKLDVLPPSGDFPESVDRRPIQVAPNRSAAIRDRAFRAGAPPRSAVAAGNGTATLPPSPAISSTC